MGTGPFAVPSCEKLKSAGHEIVQVVVRPPVSNSSSKKAPPPSPVAQWAEQQQLPIYQPASINAEDSLARLKEFECDLYFVCDYGQILSQACLSIPKLGGINLHGSLLPRHRGAAPVQWTLLSGDEEAGVSVIHMTPGLDAGPVISVKRLMIEPDENAGQLEVRLSQAGAAATIEAVELLERWDRQSVIGQVQDKKLATKAPRLSKTDGQLDFQLSAVELERKVRGYQPWPGTFGELIYSDSKRIALHIRAARAITVESTPEALRVSHRAIGQAWSASALQLGWQGPQWQAPWDQLMFIQTGSGLLAVASVQPAGKRQMNTSEFLRGHPLTSTAYFATNLT